MSVANMKGDSGKTKNGAIFPHTGYALNGLPNPVPRLPRCSAHVKFPILPPSIHSTMRHLLALALGLLLCSAFLACRNGTEQQDTYQSDTPRSLSYQPTLRPAQELEVISHGAAGRVSGSLHEVRTPAGTLLVDCGLFYPDGDPGQDFEARQAEAQRLSETLPPGATQVDAVLLTHAHLDHVGRLPLLIRSGYQGKVYCTPVTARLLRLMLLSQIRYDDMPRTWVFSQNSIKKSDDGRRHVTAHWRSDCKWRQRIKDHNARTHSGRRTDIERKLGLDLAPCTECGRMDLDPVLAHVVELPYDYPYQVVPHIEVTFLDAGHIPGSASILIETGGRRLLFSGDVGNDLSQLQPGPKPFPQVDALWIESTYGATVRSPDVANEFQRFQRTVADALKSRKVVWIPAFALDRTQKVLHNIQLARQKGLLPGNVPVYCPSPLAAEITDLYVELLHNGTAGFRTHLYDHPEAVFAPQKRHMPKHIQGPCIMITTSGMMDAAFSESLASQLLPRSDVAVFLVGYQDPGTIGGQLRAGNRQVTWEGTRIDVAATVHNFSAFSAHADAADLLRLLANQLPDTPLFLVHGDPSASKALASFLQKNGFHAAQPMPAQQPVRIGQ